MPPQIQVIKRNYFKDHQSKTEAYIIKTNRQTWLILAHLLQAYPNDKPLANQCNQS